MAASRRPPRSAGLLLASVLSATTPGVAAKWELKKEPPWVPHTGSIAVPLATGHIVLLGGQAGEHGGALFDCFNCTNEVWDYSAEEDAWTDLTSEVPWDPRWGHSAVATEDDTVYLMFGCCEKGKPTVMLRDMWMFNPTKGIPWSRVAASPGPPFEGIQAAAVALRGDELWVTGGWSQHRGTLSLVAKMSIKSNGWELVSKHGLVPWKHRADHEAAISPDGDWLFIFAGQHRDAKTGDWSRLQDTWRLPLANPSASQWTQLGDLNAPRSSARAILLPSGWLVTLGGHWVPDSDNLNDKGKEEEIVEHHLKQEFRVYNDILAMNLNTGGAEGWKEVDADAVWPARDDCAGALTPGGGIAIFGGGTVYGGGGYLRDVWMLRDADAFYGLSMDAKQEL